MFCVPLIPAHAAHASNMSPISDLIVWSQPSTSTPHIITFRVTNAVPVSGTLTITPEGAFSIPGGFSVSDVDVSVSTGGPYVQRDLAAVSSATEDGVSIVSGSAGSVTITLNSTDGIPAGALVRVVLGTAATHQSSGSISPVNAASPGSYRIRVDTASGVTGIDSAKAMIVVVLPVSLTTEVTVNAPIISFALPTGTVPAGSNMIELSFQTNVAATCKYATSSGISYGSMTNSFSSVAGVLFYTVVSGHVDNTSYTYYIKCRDTFGATAVDDYELTFSLGSTPTVTSSDGTTPNTQSVPGAGTGGSGGAGSFAGGSSLLFQSGVTISGYAPANSSVTLLKDGVLQRAVQAQSNGAFSGNISGLERGTYTFVAFATDGSSRKTSRFSSTLTLNSGTNNAISGVVLSPTIAADSESVAVGTDVRISGVGVPNSVVGILVRDVPAAEQAGIAKEYSASTSPENASGTGGAWEFTVPARDLKRGTYEMKVKTVMPSASSEYSAPVFVGYGEEPTKKTDSGNRSDINGDGKVNLVDFSILLTHWNEEDPDADINEDGIVNLADFSILLFNWTG